MPRYSIFQNDDGFANWYARAGCEWSVTLDGREIGWRCVTADEERGFAICRQVADDGRFIQTAEGKLAFETLRGAVVVSYRDTRDQRPKAISNHMVI